MFAVAAAVAKACSPKLILSLVTIVPRGTLGLQARGWPSARAPLCMAKNRGGETHEPPAADQRRPRDLGHVGVAVSPPGGDGGRRARRVPRAQRRGADHRG